MTTNLVVNLRENWQAQLQKNRNYTTIISLQIHFLGLTDFHPNHKNKAVLQIHICATNQYMKYAKCTFKCLINNIIEKSAATENNTMILKWQQTIFETPEDEKKKMSSQENRNPQNCYCSSKFPMKSCSSPQQSFADLRILDKCWQPLKSG